MAEPLAERSGFELRAEHMLKGRKVASRALFLWLAMKISTGTAAGELLRVSDAWVSPTVPGQTVGAAYMRVHSAQDAALVKIETDVSSAAEIHEMKIVNDVMRMRRIDQVELPAGQTVDLAPGGRHVMLAGLRHPLRVGDSVSITLTFRLGNGRMARETFVVPVLRKAAHGAHQ